MGIGISIYKCFVRCVGRIWERMFIHFASEHDMEKGMIDRSIVRAHPCAADA